MTGDSRPGRVLDISRLVSRLRRRAPTGIDRVEFAYARHYAPDRERDDRRFLLTTPLSTGLLSPAVARRLVRSVAERWSAPAPDPNAGRAFAQLNDLLRAPVAPDGGSQARRIVAPRAGLDAWSGAALTASAYLQAAIGRAFDPNLDALRGTPFWYLHVSHINLHDAARLRWLNGLPARTLFMVHDLIPISHPEYFNADESALHRRRLATMVQLADMLIFNSRATQAACIAYLDAAGLRRPPGAVVPLAVDDVFLAPGVPDETWHGTPYFVVVGTIEGRKNLSFLLQVWREWIAKHPVPPARLVIAGRRGWQADSVFDLLERCAPIATSAIEVADLSDAQMARVMRGARALLAPSLIEGFGLPVAEALALGVPVVASDVAAHREAGGGFADYLDPTDGIAWMAALDDLAADPSARRSAMLDRMRALRPMSWAQHIACVEAVLREAEAGPAWSPRSDANRTKSLIHL